MDMNPAADGRAPAGPGPVEIRPATEDDLPQIVEILNYTAANSIANFVDFAKGQRKDDVAQEFLAGFTGTQETPARHPGSSNFLEIFC